jgi:glycosyltransferase involved in cell wall biosynthesis
MNTKKNIPFLTIAIPTYNRAEKLNALLSRIKTMLESSPLLLQSVGVVVSDNASTDHTLSILKNYKSENINYSYFIQSKNLGLDRNMLFLYQQVKTEYIWYFSDDDILFPGAIERVLNALINEAPTALLFSFIQPVNATTYPFNFTEEVSIIRDPERVILLLSQYPKLSIYVYKHIHLDSNEWSYLSQFINTDFYFIALGYSLFKISVSPKLAVISLPLAGCDSEFNQIRFSPQTWGNAWIVFKHSYVKVVSPNLEKIKRQISYYDQIQALFAVKTGALTVPDIKIYDDFIRNLEVKLIWLLQNPRSMGQIIFLKLGLTSIWVKLISHSGK